MPIWSFNMAVAMLPKEVCRRIDRHTGDYKLFEGRVDTGKVSISLNVLDDESSFLQPRLHARIRAENGGAVISGFVVSTGIIFWCVLAVGVLVWLLFHSGANQNAKLFVPMTMAIPLLIAAFEFVVETKKLKRVLSEVFAHRDTQ